MFHNIYVPISVDTYGTRHNKAALMSMMMLSPALGVLCGYITTAFLGSWIISFRLNGLIMIGCALALSMIPAHYLNVNFTLDLIKKERILRNNEVGLAEIGGTG